MRVGEWVKEKPCLQWCWGDAVLGVQAMLTSTLLFKEMVTPTQTEEKGRGFKPTWKRRRPWGWIGNKSSLLWEFALPAFLFSWYLWLASCAGTWLTLSARGKSKIAQQGDKLGENQPTNQINPNPTEKKRLTRVSLGDSLIPWPEILLVLSKAGL